MTEEEREILDNIVQTWIDSDAPLPGCYSYQDVENLLNKLGATVPPWLKSLSGI